jgi:hypothetical protein
MATDPERYPEPSGSFGPKVSEHLLFMTESAAKHREPEMVPRVSSPRSRATMIGSMAVFVALTWIANPARGATLDRCLNHEELTASAAELYLSTDQISALANPDVCVGSREVQNGSQDWHILIVQNRANPGRLLWYAPHTNEGAAFTTGIGAVRKFGGTLVAVRTRDGKRCQNGEDPNRIFGATRGAGNTCEPQSKNTCRLANAGETPPFTAAVMAWYVPDTPIIALHTNEFGYRAGICPDPPATGSGDVTAACKHGHVTPWPASGHPPRGASPSDTMVYVSGKIHTDQARALDPSIRTVTEELNRANINVVYEYIKDSDCSFSNYAIINGIKHYYNSEILDGDSKNQAEIVEVLVGVLAKSSILAPSIAHDH